MALVMAGAVGAYFHDNIEQAACEGLATYQLWDAAKVVPDCIVYMPVVGGEDESMELSGAVRPDHPGEAITQRLAMMSDEKGQIPEGAIIHAAEQLDAMRAAAARSTEVESSAKRGVKRGTWTSIGPGNIGGRTRSIVIDPTNASKMWLGSVSGGIWKTTNGGTSWSPVNDFLANLAVSTMVINPATPATMYAGTGEGFYNGHGIRGAGILKSTNGGTSWSQLSSTNNSNFQYVNRLAISADGQTLLAATRTGLWRSTNGGTSWSHRLTVDAYFVAINPNDKTKAVLGTGTEGAYYSTDGGSTWKLASGAYNDTARARTELAYAPSNPLIVYMSADRNGGEIWKSTNGGASYARVSTGKNYLGNQGWYANTIWVSPTDPNLVVVAGLDIWRSTNGGSSLTQISEWQSSPVSAHADHHYIVAHPGYNGTTNNTVFFGNDGGIYKAANVKTVSKLSGWKELNNGLVITQFYSAAGNPTSGKIIGGAQDNGTLFYKPGTGASEKWTETFGGDGGYSAADPTNANYFYGEYVFLQIHRSTNAGVTADYIYTGISDAGSCAEFIAPFMLDPNNASRMIAGGCSLWRTNNVKATNPTWTRIKPARSGNPNITAIAVGPGDPGFIVVGYTDGAIYYTYNGTASSPTWTKATGVPGRRVNALAIAQDANTVYAGFSGFSADNIYRSTNGAQSFAKRSGPVGSTTAIPSAPVYSIVVDYRGDATHQNWIYAGTEVGVVASEDGGGHWFSPNEGPAKVSVDQLVFVGSKLIAATHGRGMFSTTPVDMP